MSHLRFSIIAFVFLLIGLLVPTQVSADTYSISITGTQFIPGTLNASVGDTIRFINTTTATQSAKTTDLDGFNTGNIGPGENKSVVLSTAGTFSYTSQYSPSLTGTIIVAASADALGGTTSTASTTTSQPATTQAQPVSGVYEVLLAVLAGGAGFIALGMATHRFQPTFGTEDTTISLPSISIHSDHAEESDDSSAANHDA